MPEEISPIVMFQTIRAGSGKPPNPNDTIEMKAMRQRFHQELVSTAPWDKFPKVGSKFPDFVLPDPLGEMKGLESYRANGPVVVVFYRGNWCPYCATALRVYQRYLIPTLSEFNASLVAISPQLPDGSLTTKEVNELDFAVLSDVGNAYAKTLHLSFLVPPAYIQHLDETDRDLRKINGVDDEVFELVMPATFVIDRHGIVQFAEVRPDYSLRTEPAEIIDALRSMSSAKPTEASANSGSA